MSEKLEYQMSKDVFVGNISIVLERESSEINYSLLMRSKM